MIDQLIIGDKYSFDDFGASLSTRKIGQPKKKTIKESVPYSNITYDFSAINGEVYWEERELEYVFEMTAPTAEQIEEMKAAFADWVMNITQERIYDPFIFGYHFVGTFSDMSFDDDEGLDKTTATVKFTAYPYKVSNLVKKYTFTIAAKGTLAVTLVNNSSHRIAPKFISDYGFQIIRNTADGKETWSIDRKVGESEIVDAYTGNVFMLAAGVTQLQLQNDGLVECTVEFTFNEEIQ